MLIRNIVGLVLAFSLIDGAVAQSWEKVIPSETPGSAIGAGSDNTIYAGVRGGQVYRSDNNGESWTAVNSGLADSFNRFLIPNAFVIGANGRIIRGGPNGSWENRIGSPVFYTDNEGANWVEAPLPFGSPAPNPAGISFADLVFHQGAVYGSDLLSGGVWKSADNGESWVSVGATLPTVSQFISNTKTYPAIASAGNALLTAEGLRGLFRSIDGGETWTQAVNGIPGVINSPLVGGRSWAGVDVVGETTGLAYAVVDQNLYRSTDGGASWREIGDGLFMARKVAMENNTVYVASEGASPVFFESVDQGVSWRKLPSLTSGAITADTTSQSFAVHNGALYFAGGDGIYRLNLSTAAKSDIAPLVRVNRTGPVLGNVGIPIQAIASAEGTAPFSYSWRLDGVEITGQDSASLNWAPSSASQAGELSLVVSNPGGSTNIVIGDVTIAPIGPGMPDYSFKPQLIAGAAIHAMAIDADGSIFFGGSGMWSFSGETYRGVRHAFADGSIDYSFVTGVIGGNGSGPVNGQIPRTMIPMGDGSVLVGAAGTGNNDRYWRRLLSDGSIDPNWPWPELMAGGPWKAARLPNGKYLVGSGSIGGLHRLNSDGTIDTSFTVLGSIGSFQRQYVRDFVVQADGKIVIVGLFNNIDGVTRRGIARLKPNGGLDLTFVPDSIDSNREISTLLPLPDGKFLVGGSFTTIAGASRPYLARLTAEGKVDTTFPAQIVNAQPFAFARQPDGKIWVGGSFAGASGRNYLLRMDADGVVDTTIPDLGLDGAVQMLQLADDGKLWIGGAFTQLGTYPAGQLVRIFTDLTGPAIAYGGLSQTPIVGESIVLQGGASGPFTSAQWLFNGNAIEGATSLTLPLNNVSLANSGSYQLVLQSAGGASTSAPVSVRVRGAVVIDRQPEPAIAILTSNATFSVTAFGQPPFTYQWYKDNVEISGATGSALTVNNVSFESAADYTVRVTGADDSEITSEPAFLTVVPRPGTRDNTFVLGLLSGEINDWVFLPNGKILVIGSFNLPGAVSFNRVARLNSDGSVDATFAFNADSFSEVTAIGVQSSGKIILSVRLTTGGGSYQIRRFLPDGAPDDTFAPVDINFPGGLQIAPDDTIFVGHGKLTKLSAEGVRDTVFENQLSFVGGGLSAIALDEEGRIYISGGFYQINGKPRQYLARVLPDGSLDETFAGPPSINVIQDLRAVSGGVIYSTFDSFVRLDETGAVDLDWAYTGKLSPFDVAADGSSAGFTTFNSGNGPILDANGRPGIPFATFNAPQANYRRIKIAGDGSFWLAATTTTATNALIRVAGTVTPIAIVTQPLSATVNSGETITLKAAAVGTSAITYQWQRNGIDLAGETGESLVIADSTTAANGDYRVIVKNRSGAIESRVATVFVLDKPEIVSLSPSASIGIADSMRLSVVARGVAPMSYQWRLNGQPIAGATFAVYTNLAVAKTDSGDYDVVITNPRGTTTSSAINISVVVLPGAVIGSFNPQIGSGVNELALLPDGRILIGRRSGGVTLHTPSGDLDSSFTIFGGNNTDWIEKIAVNGADNRIYISPASSVRAIDFTGANIASFNSPPINTRIVRLEAAGSILLADNGIHPTLRRASAEGVIDSGFNASISDVRDFRPLPNGKILALTASMRVEGFSYVFDTALVRLNSDGSLDSSFTRSDNVFVMNNEAAGINVDRQGRIFVWGAFDNYLGQARSRIVRLEADGAIDTSFNPVTINGGISDIAEQEDGKLIIVGAFTQVDNVPRGLVARLNADGSHDASFNPGSGLTRSDSQQSIAFDVELTPDGNILVGGTFTLANGLPRNGIALLTGGGEENSGTAFDQWAAEAGLTGPDAAPASDPDHDGVVNQAEFIYGTSPTSATARPIFSVEQISVDNQSYPTVTFTRRIGGNVQVQASAAIDFTTLLDTVAVSVTPAATSGFEEVTIRTTQPRGSASAQFFRIIAQ